METIIRSYLYRVHYWELFGTCYFPITIIGFEVWSHSPNDNIICDHIKQCPLSFYNPLCSLYSNKHLWRSSERNYPLFSFSLFLCLFFLVCSFPLYFSLQSICKITYTIPLPLLSSPFLPLYTSPSHHFLTTFSMSVNIFTIFLTLPFFYVFFLSLSFIWSSSCHELARRSNKPTLEKYLSKFSTMF